MGDLRKPFLLLAMLAIVLAIGVELGAGLLLGGADAGAALADSAGALDVEIDDVSGVSEPSGRGTGYLALIDAVAVWSTGLLPGPAAARAGSGSGAGRRQPDLLDHPDHRRAGRACHRVRGAVIMVSLFLAVPFGTLAYLALWGFFPVGEAAVLLGLVLLLKLVWAGMLVLAQPRFLQNKGLVLLILTTLLCTVVLEFLHNLVPVILVSIVDDVAALVFAIIAIIWGLVLLIGSIPAIVKAIRVTAALPARARATNRPFLPPPPPPLLPLLPLSPPPPPLPPSPPPSPPLSPPLPPPPLLSLPPFPPSPPPPPSPLIMKLLPLTRRTETGNDLIKVDARCWRGPRPVARFRVRRRPPHRGGPGVGAGRDGDRPSNANATPTPGIHRRSA